MAHSLLVLFVPALAGLALVCIGVGALLLVLAACMPSASGDAQDAAGDEEDQHAAFISSKGYTKL